MTRETKVGLLIGLGVILLIGIILTDHLAIQPVDAPPPLIDSVPVDETGAQPEVGGERIIEQAAPQRRGDRAWTRRPDSTGPWGPTPRTSQQATRNGAPTRVADNAHPMPAPGHRPLTPLEPNRGPMRTGQVEPPSAMNVARARGFRSTVGTGPGAMPPANVTPVRKRQEPRRVEETEAKKEAARQTPAQAERVVPRPRPVVMEEGQRAAPTSSRRVFHTVRSGETLYEIAERYLGDGERYDRIIAANPGRVRRNGHVNQGVRIMIPPRRPTTSDDTAAADTAKRKRDREGAAPAEQATTVKVKGGDSLSSLAERYLGAQSQWPRLLEANRDLIENENMLRVGMKLKIPGRGAERKKKTSPRKRTGRSHVKTRQAGRTYKVREGDTLWKIARDELGDASRHEEILRANADRLRDANRIRPGMVIALPVAQR